MREPEDRDTGTVTVETGWTETGQGQSGLTVVLNMFVDVVLSRKHLVDRS